jgi:hypothetical protein
MATITATNSVFALAVKNVFPVPQILVGYAVDSAFSVESAEVAQVVMGVDGRMSGGFTPFITKMTVELQADSPSLTVFDQWINAMKAAREVFTASATIQIQSIGKLYVCSNGILTSLQQMPSAKKILQPVQYIIQWESVVPTNV